VSKPSLKSSDARLVYEVPEAGAMLGLTRNASYDAAKRGDIPTIRIGKLLRVPKAAFHKLLEDAGVANSAHRNP
jgi:excisionase family DNA binding protein